MALKDSIKTILQEAELYHGQGLLAEAKEKYQQAQALIEGSEQVKNREKLLEGIHRKIAGIELHDQKVQQTAATSPELSEKARELIKRLFSFSKEESAEAAALEGAIALAKFGQFSSALTEFNKLIRKESHRTVAAKNILRCHIALASEKAAVKQYEEWVESDLFSVKQLESIRVFLEDNIPPEALEKPLSAPAAPAASAEEETARVEEEFIDISSIGIPFESGPAQGKVIEFDVNFQSGNLLSLIVPQKEGNIIEDLAVGTKINDLQFYSPIAIFNGAGVVSEKSQIKSGPKQGDFCLDIEITST